MSLTPVQIQELKALKEAKHLNWLKYKQAVQTGDKTAQKALEKEMGYSSTYLNSLKKRLLTSPSLIDE